MKEEESAKSDKQKSAHTNELLNTSNEEDQTVFKIFGIEMTAPAGLQNPGIIYISFIVINILIFVLIKRFVTS
tara:strand:+ start:244 stop:462 length:219 start_codon:yes stop_codon:yes gene_type:complete